MRPKLIALGITVAWAAGLKGVVFLLPKDQIYQVCSVEDKF
jgi:hypothetical protein